MDAPTFVRDPQEIERRSMATIAHELGHRADGLSQLERSILLRVIHTTADFSFADTLTFTHGAAQAAFDALHQGATILTDTNMARAGVNKVAAERQGCKVVCYMADPEVAAAARSHGTTRAVASMDRACDIEGPLVIAIGNAPTALARIVELVRAGKLHPAAVIGVPVGFVNVVEAKELVLQSQIPAIVARGRRGGSNIAASIVNALLYAIARPGWESAPVSADAISASSGSGATASLDRLLAALDMPHARVGVFAGTSDGRRICEALAASGAQVRTFVATPYGASLMRKDSLAENIEVRVGRLNEQQMRDALADCVAAVDATHPYAREVSANVRAACASCNIPLVRACRAATDLPKNAVRARDAADAARIVAREDGNVLLVTGVKELPTFMSELRAQAPAQGVGVCDRIWGRVLPTVEAIRTWSTLGMDPSHLIGMQGPFSHEMNVATLHLAQAKWLVTKDSGVAGGMPEKLSACAECGVTPVVLERPADACSDSPVDPESLVGLLMERKHA